MTRICLPSIVARVRIRICFRFKGNRGWIDAKRRHARCLSPGHAAACALHERQRVLAAVAAAVKTGKVRVREKNRVENGKKPRGHSILLLVLLFADGMHVAVHV